MPSDYIKIGNHNLPVEVAITEEEQVRGLMYVDWPPPTMIFPFEKEAVRKFWMRNTISPLDIIFCLNSKIISICQGEPLSLKLLGPDIASDLIIEMPAGSVKKLGIKIEDRVEVKYSMETVAKKLRARIQKSGA